MIWLLFVLLPVCLIYRNDLKTIAKENLAVSLEERLVAGFFFVPLWMIDLVLIKIIFF